MPEFEESRDRLAASRHGREEARLAALSAREHVTALRRRLAAARRTAGDGEQVAALEEEYDAAVSVAKATRHAVSEARRAEAAFAAELAAFTDPRENLQRLTQWTPILLLPLRLETRFKQSPAGAPQLWVRVYPDVCHVDGFEETLSVAEVGNGGAFWAAMWRAGGDEARERGAWRDLVAAHGAGRAGWVVRRLVPRNPADKPVATDGTLDLVLVSSGPEPPETSAYWQAVWSAQGDPDALAAAKAALVAGIGQSEADRVTQHPPVNLADPPPAGLTPGETTPRLTVLQLPSAEEVGARTTSWSSPPRVETLPDRFVLAAWDDAGGAPDLVEVGAAVPGWLQAGPDPQAEPDEQLAPDGADPDHLDDLRIPDALAWMFDFEKALEVGMAFRVDLTADRARRGFDRLVVLGVRIGETADAGAAAVTRLLEHHLHSRSGLELLRQGTPTNGAADAGSGWTWRDDPETTFASFVRAEPAYDREADPDRRRDGQRLADALGLPDDLATRIPGAGLTDRVEARAMQTALWPATVGYLMDTLLAPVFSDEAVEETRRFFTSHVSGRGPLPAIRIGDQPYGIQPAVAFSRLEWFDDQRQAQLPSTLVRLIRQVEADWTPLVASVSRLGGGAPDPHQELLDVIGLHPHSVEYFPLSSDSLVHKLHELSYVDSALAAALLAAFPPGQPVDLLRRLGYAGVEVPDVLTRIYHPRQHPLDGPIVDDVPLSETAPIRAYAGGRNYIEWLADAAGQSMTALQAEEGFDDGTRPAALLYLLLRHALQLSFRQSAVDLLVDVGALDRTVLLRREPAFVHVAEPAAEGAPSESRYSELFAVDERVTGDARSTVGDFIASRVRELEGSVLPEQLDALDLLATLPTARLERLLGEHLDTTGHRIDAWRTGLLGWAIDQLRVRRDHRSSTGGVTTHHDPSVGARGLHLGGYGWVEDLRPEGKDLEAAAIAPDVAAVVDRAGDGPLLHDPTNLGLVHAPSLNHASTAAILRNAHIAHEGRMSVDLSSRRVQLALSVLEGIREGQSLGALLGYRFERHLHDHGPAGVHALVYPLRRSYPLAADRIDATATTDGDPAESIAAMNVVDGRRLLRAAEAAGEFSYPFGNGVLPRRPAPEEDAVTAALSHIRDVNDAVADLVLAEGVHQAVLGNYDRSAGTLQAFATGSYPPEPDVVRTPRPGTGLTFRVGLHLPASGPANPLTGVPLTPLATADPALNRWLADRLPPPGQVTVNVTYGDRVTGADETVTITQTDLGLQPADLLYRLGAASTPALGDLDDRILEHLHAHQQVRLDRPVTLHHTSPVAGTVTFFELEALLHSLRRTVLGARPLEVADLVRQGDARSADQGAAELPRARLQDARDHMAGTLGPTLGALATLVADTGSDVDDVIAGWLATLAPFAGYRLPQAGTGTTLEWRTAAYGAVTRTLAERVTAWDDRLQRHEALVAAHDPSAPEAERLQLLRTAEVLISTTVTAATPGDLAPKAAAFEAHRDALHEVATVPRSTLTELLSDASALADVAAFDPEPLDLSRHLSDVARFRTELAARLSELQAEVDRRVTAADAELAAHDTGPAGARAGHVQAGLRSLFGDDLLVVPSFTLPAAAAAELDRAAAHSASGDLTRHLTDPSPAGSGRDFPVDDWLHGVARVRDRVHHVENVILLSEAFPGARPPVMRPLQLPHQDGQPWLALEYPAEEAPDSERLLYTALADDPIEADGPVCGLLVDEWTEVVPAREITTGVAFHHDRPNAEPPQAWLLAVPAASDGVWSFDQLLGAVTETLDAAKLRALEPSHLDTTPYDALLPATHSAWTYPEISISLNLLRNRSIYQQILEG